MAVDFSAHVSEGRAWAASSGLAVKTIEAENKLVFSRGSISFFVVCPCEVDESWHVWSNDDRVLACLNGVHDFVNSSRRRQLKEVLACVQRNLASLVMENDNDDDNEDYCENQDLDDYYTSDAQDESESMEYKEENENEEEFSLFSNCGNSVATKRLIKDYKELQKSSKLNLGITGCPRNSNLFVWDVKLTDFCTKSTLGKDLVQFATKYSTEAALHLEMQFPDNYPMAPPFVRLLKPRLKFLTGHVTIGGSICMQLLTNSGWTPTNDIESILVQIRTEISSDPNVAIDPVRANQQYTESEARDAFNRMVHKYKWN